MQFERTFDYRLATEIITHPRVYRHMVSDGGEPRETYRAPESEKLWYILVRDGLEVLGLFLMVPTTSVCFDVHTCLLPAAWGERAQQAYREGIRWALGGNTPARKLIGNVPAYNRHALRIALRAGAKLIGINEGSIQKGGKLFDQYIVGFN